MSLFIGLLAGLFGGLVGLGGGAVMIPLMVRFFQFTQHQAHGTSLAALVFTGLAGALTYSAKGSVNLTAALLLAASAILTARFGALYANALPEWKLKRAFGIFLVLISLLLLSKSSWSYLALPTQPATGWVGMLVLLATGAGAGFLSGMMGVGGGAPMVAAMVLMLGMSQYAAQGTSLTAMVPASLVGAFTHWRLQNVVTRVLPGLIPGIIVGTFLGANLAHLLSEANLRLVFAAVLIWLGLRDIRTALKKKALLLAHPPQA